MPKVPQHPDQYCVTHIQCLHDGSCLAVTASTVSAHAGWSGKLGHKGLVAAALAKQRAKKLAADKAAAEKKALRLAATEAAAAEAKAQRKKPKLAASGGGIGFQKQPAQSEAAAAASAVAVAVTQPGVGEEPAGAAASV